MLRRVDAYSQLEGALAFVRQAAGVVTGSSAVYLERFVETMSHCGVTVVADRHGTVEAIGRTDGSLQVGYRSWIEELGPDVAGGALDDKLTSASAALARELGWIGVGRVRWALTPHGGWHLLGFSARLTTGYNLVEEVFGVDLLSTQLRIQGGDRLSWQEADYSPHRHAMQLRVFHVDPTDAAAAPTACWNVSSSPRVSRWTWVWPRASCAPERPSRSSRRSRCWPTRGRPRSCAPGPR